MANESRITIAFQIRKTSGNVVTLEHTYTASYAVDVSGAKGPVPGAINVPVDGVAISLAELSNPGWCWLHNLHPSHNIHIGIRDPDSGLFYPLLMLKPGMRYLIYLSQELGEEYQGTGTGTGVPANQLWAKALSPDAKTSVTATLAIHAFEA